AEINELSKDHDQTHSLLKRNIDKLSDLRCVFYNATILQKQELLNQVFDSSLYYQNKIYRTPSIMPLFNHNTQVLKEKQLLIVDQMNEKRPESPAKWR
ncbi:MAG TPA: hypothetical protein VGG71_02275, partial [Chitinophagaceae bacterium]